MRHRDFSAHAPKVSWCGDITEIPTGEGKLTWPWCGTCSHASYWPVLPARTHPDAELACGAIEIATTVRGGHTRDQRGRAPHPSRINLHRTVFHRPGGCLGPRQSTGRVGPCLLTG
jgi:putative transposase